MAKKMRLKTEAGSFIADYNNSKTESFKDRSIDLSKKVEVYRNLNKKGTWYSVKQNGLVVGRSRQLILRDVTFKVSEAICEKVKVTGERSVHAFAVGFYTDHMLPEENLLKLFKSKIKYDPFIMNGFEDENGNGITSAVYLYFNKDGLHAYKPNIIRK